MQLNFIRMLISCYLSALTIAANAQNPKNISKDLRLPKDPVTGQRLIASLNGFFKQQKNPIYEN